MNKKDLMRNFKDYSPEQIAEAIKSGVVTSYELLHETGGAYTPLLKRKVKRALEQMELSNPIEESIDCNDGSESSQMKQVTTALSKISSLEVPDINSIPVPDDNIIDTEETNSNNKSKARMFSNPFSFKGRIRRTEYGISMIICFFVNLCLNVLVGVLCSGSSESSGILVFYMILLLIPYLWFVWAQGAKRCHDRGNSGFYQLIPFYGFWLLFAEGDSVANKYGANPKN